VHPSTVSRAVAGKYVHTAQGCSNCAISFRSRAGPVGGATPLLLLKRMVKKMIADEDRSKPLTDEQITAMLQVQGTTSHGARWRNTARI